MGEWAEIPELLKLTKADIAVWLVTFALTVFADLTVAVEVGMVLAMLLFIRKVSRTTTVTSRPTEYVEGRAAHPAGQAHPRLRHGLPHHGPFLFGATDRLSQITDHVQR